MSSSHKLSRSRSRRALCAGCWVALGVLATGCRTPEPKVHAPAVPIDPCAERLHDIAGQLLLYYSLHKELPPALDALKSLNAPQLPPLVCPVSGQPYVYAPDGVPVAGSAGRLVLFEPRASHSGMRWGVLLIGPGTGGSLTARVIVVPEGALSPSPVDGQVSPGQDSRE